LLAYANPTTRPSSSATIQGSEAARTSSMRAAISAAATGSSSNVTIVWRT